MSPGVFRRCELEIQTEFNLDKMSSDISIFITNCADLLSRGTHETAGTSKLTEVIQLSPETMWNYGRQNVAIPYTSTCQKIGLT